MKKFNGHRCERRNLTDLLLDGAGPDGTKRKQPKAKKRPKNFTTEPAANKKLNGGPTSPVESLLDVLAMQSSPGYTKRAGSNMDAGTQALMQYTTAAQGRILEPMTDKQKAETNYALNKEKLRLGLPEYAQGLYAFEQRSAEDRGYQTGGPVRFTGSPGELPDFLREYLNTQGGLNMASSVGQTAGSLISNIGTNASDPSSKYGVQEGLGAAISGATNPLAMTFGPVGMGVGALLGLGKSLFTHKKEKNEVNEMQREMREERIAMNVDSAKSFSDQVLNTYDQQGVGGGLYARHGGPVDRFYTGGPTEPPVESVADPRLAPGVGRDEGVFRPDTTPRDTTMENVREYATKNPLDAVGLGLAIGGQIPVLGEPLDLANAILSGGRGIYNTVIGDTDKAAEQFGYAALSGASVLPFAGNIPALGRIAHGAHKLERGVIAGKGYKAATYDSMEMGGPVDYETEKSEVILASPSDPPVAVGQGEYKRVSNNLYRAKGPSHKHGGIPTRGATEPFVDSTGQFNDSPYVFSDAKEMRFDPSDILSMIS